MMNFFDRLFGKQKSDSSKIAKERLQMMISYDRGEGGGRGPDFMDALRAELMEVIKKYMKVDEKEVEIRMDREGNCDMLGISISAPIDSKGETPAAAVSN